MQRRLRGGASTLAAASIDACAPKEERLAAADVERLRIVRQLALHVRATLRAGARAGGSVVLKREQAAVWFPMLFERAQCTCSSTCSTISSAVISITGRTKICDDRDQERLTSKLYVQARIKQMSDFEQGWMLRENDRTC